MTLWIVATFCASMVQTLRFMLQKQIKLAGLSTAGATLARFVWGAPMAAVFVLLYGTLSGQSLPQIPAQFWGPALWGGVSQILATMCVVALFSHRNFAVGITFKKTEVMLAALVGFVVLGEGVSLFALLAILIGFGGMVLLSKPPEGGLTLWNRATGLGLASGVLFAFSGVGYRAASLSLDSADPMLRAGVTLALVATSQALILGACMGWREADQLRAVFVRWRITWLVGLTSAVGSFCWFLAFTLQTAAYVKALGQVELILSFAISWFVFRERSSAREVAGAGLIVLSVLVLVLTL